MTAPPTTPTLHTFLTRCLDADEAVALAAAERTSNWPADWTAVWSWSVAAANADGATGFAHAVPGAPSPAATLARVAALREVLALHEDCECGGFGPLVFDADPEVSAGTDAYGGLVIRRSIGTQQVLDCPTVLAVAAIFADQAGYEEWA